MTRIEIVMMPLLLLSGSIQCNSLVYRMAGGMLCMTATLGVLQSAHDIKSGIQEIRELLECEEPQDYIRHMMPSIVADRFVSVKSGPIFAGAGFCTMLNGIMRLCLAKKGWDMLWSADSDLEQQERGKA